MVSDIKIFTSEYSDLQILINSVTNESNLIIFWSEKPEAYLAYLRNKISCLVGDSNLEYIYSIGRVLSKVY